MLDPELEGRTQPAEPAMSQPVGPRSGLACRRYRHDASGGLAVEGNTARLAAFDPGEESGDLVVACTQFGVRRGSDGLGHVGKFNPVRQNPLVLIRNQDPVSG